MSSPDWRGRRDVPTEDFALRLIAARKMRGLTIEEAAELAAIPATSWSTWERGAMPRRYVDVVEQIGAALGVDPMWLAFGSRAVTDQPMVKTTRSCPPPAATFTRFVQSPLLAAL